MSDLKPNKKEMAEIIAGRKNAECVPIVDLNESKVMLTNFGFDWGNMAVERSFDSGGHIGIRIRSMTSGEYIDIQMSKGGRKLFGEVTQRSNKLKGFDPFGGRKKIIGYERETAEIEK